MMMKYEYRDSGIDWMGTIPKHWKIEKIKYVTNQIIDGTHFTPEYIDDEEGIAFLRVTDVQTEFINLNRIKRISFEEHRELNKRCNPEKGDLLLSKNGTIGLTKIVDWDFPCSLFVSLCLIKPMKKVEARYLDHLFKGGFFDQQISDGSKATTVTNLHLDKIREFKFITPPIPEQIAIANYLDKACADIDRVVEIKRQQIENLHEQLKTQISNWFATSNQSQLKKTDSLVIPEIPTHWQLLKLKRVLEEKLKYGANESGDLDNPDDPRYIRITDFDDDGSLRDDTFKSLPPEVAKEYLLSEGDVLFARSGATVGKTFIFKNYKGVACYAGYLIKAVTLKYKMLPDYLYYFTKTKMYEDWKNIIFTQATIQNIGADKYQYLPVPVPPIEEQKEILRKTELLNERIKKAQSVIERQIDTLVNYKKSLIHEVVTGKKQVYGLSSTGSVQNKKQPTQTD